MSSTPKRSIPKTSSPEELSLTGSLGTDPNQIQERFVRSSLTEDVDEFGKVGADVSYFQSQMHSEYDPAESIADSDPEDGELRKMLASPLYLQNLLEWETIAECTGETCCIVFLWKWRTGKSIQEFFFKNADPSNLGWSLLKGNRDHLLYQAKSELMRQEQQVGSLNNCISELQQQPCAQRLELQDAQHGYIESRRDQVRLQEEQSLKEKVLRDNQIRSMHEMGEMWRAQELRVDEVSVQR